MADTRPEPAGSFKLGPGAPAREPRRRLSLAQRAGLYVLVVFAGIGLLSILSVVLLVLGTQMAMQPERSMPARVVLTLNLDSPITENPVRLPFAGLRDAGGVPLTDILAATRRGATDPRVQAIYARISSPEMGIAQAQEVAAAIRRFRVSGKQAYLYADTLGSGLAGGGLPAIALAAAFDEVWMPESGTVGLSGLAAELPFARAALDSVGAAPDFLTYGDYKDAASVLTDSDISAATREQYTTLLQDLQGQMLDSIAADRGVARGDLEALLDRGTIWATEAVEAGLVDTIGIGPQLEKVIIDDVGAEALDLSTYVRLIPYDDVDEDRAIALIPAVGAVMPGEGDPFGRGAMGSQTVARALGDAAEDDDIAAIVLRIDSPGGDYTASEVIWQAVRRAADSKPVIASMGNTAASGGYFIAMGAQRVIADPATLTGSIGVLGGKISLAGLWADLGITWTRLADGEMAGMFSPNRPFSEAQRARFAEVLQHVYDDFTAKAADSRGMAVAALDEVARGRVWSGQRARDHGLVDDLGGLHEALAAAKEAAGLDPEAPALVRLFPEPPSTFEMVRDLIREGVLPGTTVGMSGVSRAGQLAEIADAAGLDPASIRALLPWLLQAPGRPAALMAPVVIR